MRFVVVALAVASVLSGRAYASDKPVIGPAPAWVKPVSLPLAPTKPDEAAIRIVLSDQQVALEPGKQTVYSEVALKIQTPQGLAAGNISFPWSPDTDVLTVHKLLIRRGDQVIDVLASGQTFTVVRREANLESATLDGVLTANIQPEGLRVGDLLEFAASVTSSDPTLKGHVEQIAGAWNGFPIAHAHLAVQWPTTLPVRLRQTGALPPIKSVKNGETTKVTLSLDNLEPVVAPKGAPPRFQIGRMIELTDFASWSDLAALLAPLYRKAAVLPAEGPLQAEVARIRALSPDPKRRAEAALALVQDRIRYVALAMGAGGLVPADAETTWSRRYGDCKGKTALLLALLHALDIEADPVAVSTAFGDGLDARLPMIGLFNHVLVRANVAGRTYWLDGTRMGDTRLDRLEVPAFGWGLVLIPSGGTLVPMIPAPSATPTRSVAIRIDATAGLTVPAPTRIEMILRGDAAVGTNMSLANLAGEARDRALREFWKGQYDFVEVKSASATFDPETGEQRLVMDGEARMDWDNGWYEMDGAGVGYKADFSRDPGPSRDAPFAVPFPYSTRTTETILLPHGFDTIKLGSEVDVDKTLAGIEYRRHVTVAGNIVTMERSERSVAPEFPFKEAAAAETALRALAETGVYLPMPKGYRQTEKEVAATLATSPTTVDGFLDRGHMLLDLGRHDEAIAAFDRALALDPKNAMALADRGIARVWEGDLAAAARDLDAAAALDPRNAVVFRARGLMAQQKDESADAIAAYTRALEIDPDDSFALGHRAVAYRASGDSDRALADAAAAIKLKPDWIDLYLLRASLLRGEGKRDQAIAEAVAVSAANPTDPFAHVVSANIYSSFGKDAEAMRAFDGALAIKPEGYIYLNRSVRRPKTDVAGRRADIEAALRLDPKLSEAWAAKADLQEQAGDLAGAVQTYSTAISASPGEAGLLVGRGIIYARTGRTALADKDFAAARDAATDARAFNEMCWSKAIAGVALESALADCETALGKAPSVAAYLDSRGLVLLRLGRVDDAIADYDRALAKSPNLPPSLFGRALAWARKGDKAKSEADAAAALKADPDVRSDFERYGVTR